MKKACTILLAVAMCFAMTACGKSESVKSVEATIDAIGEITIESGEAIKNAEKQFNILTDSEKEKVDNRLKLVEAREKYDELQAEIVYFNAKEAYEMLNTAAELCEKGMDDIYGAWYFGIYEADDCTSSNLYTKFASKTPRLTSSELENAAKAMELSVYTVKNDWQYCLYVAEYAIASKGDYATVNEKMERASAILQELTGIYEDYTYYPKLKEYYAVVSSYVGFFTSPSGSFKQLSDTVNSYETSIRTHRSDVGFLF